MDQALLRYSNTCPLKVTLSNGNEYGAKVVGVDEQKDIAVLQLDESALLADSKAKSTLVKSLPVCDDTQPLQV